MLMHRFVETAVESRTFERTTCHFAPIVMTVFDGNQEIARFLKFSLKKLCARTKRHYLCTRKD
jgi:hypothetical protein